MLNYAFVLKRFLPFKHKFSVFDRAYGRIEIVPSPVQSGLRIWPGMMIGMNLERLGSSLYAARDFELFFVGEGIPSAFLGWFHHILELCYYSLPLDQPQPAVFLHLKASTIALMCSEYLGESLSPALQLIECSLLLEVGFYPPPALYSTISLSQKITRIFIDFSKHRRVESLAAALQIIDAHEYKNIAQWIAVCIEQHPQRKFFKARGLGLSPI